MEMNPANLLLAPLPLQVQGVFTKEGVLQLALSPGHLCQTQARIGEVGESGSEGHCGWQLP